LQTDDDCYVRVDAFLASLHLLPQELLFWGDIWWNAQPERSPEDKWFITEHEWGAEFYPPYAPGVGIVLSIDLVREIAAGEATFFSTPIEKNCKICPELRLDLQVLH
jgi:hypothetical protein